MMLLQEFLRTSTSTMMGLNLLLETRAIKTNRHTRYPNLVQFKYSMIDSPMGDPLVQECRGVILDEADNWNVVARPFCKFFNHGEGHAASIDWKTAKVQEKLDGSLMILYHYRDEWHVATSGMPDARGTVNGGEHTFATLFWQVFREKGYQLPHAENVCFMFELMTRFNRVVVQHAENRLVLLGVRAHDGKELRVGAAKSHYGWECVQEYPLDTIDHVLASFEHINPLSQEGYVVVDANFRRIKVKHPGYVAIHGMREGMSPRRILEVIRSGETSEILAHFPEWRPEFEKVGTAYNALVEELNTAYLRICQIPVQKDFALEAVKTRCSGALFSLRAKKVDSIREFLAGMQIDGLAKILNLNTEAAPLYTGEAA
jgi:hypothetical protein